MKANIYAITLFSIISFALSASGGGGGGGPSYSILIGANMAPIISNNVLISGDGGAPGTDGNGSNGGALGGRDGVPGLKGTRNGSDSGGSGDSGGKSYKITKRPDGSPAEGGWSVNVFDANLGDGLTPVLNNNIFSTGTAGNRGTALDKNF